MALLFSDAEDGILVEEVANHPSLWQLSHASFKDQRVKDSTWAEIADKVGKPIDQCKKRWKNIKDTYDRKKKKKRPAASASTKKGKKWALEGKLSFLRTGEHRGSFSNPNKWQEEEEADSPLPGDEQVSLTQTLPTESSTALTIQIPGNTLPPHPTTTYRRKRRSNREKTADKVGKREGKRNKMMKALHVEETEDDVDLFFKSLAKSVKKLTPALQQRAKAETLNVIAKLETEMWKAMQHGSFNNQHFYSDPSPIASSELSTDSDAESSPSLTEIASFSEPHLP